MMQTQTTIAEELTKLDVLRQRGTLSPPEHEEAKRILLAKHGATSLEAEQSIKQEVRTLFALFSLLGAFNAVLAVLFPSVAVIYGILTAIAVAACFALFCERNGGRMWERWKRARSKQER